VIKRLNSGEESLKVFFLGTGAADWPLRKTADLKEFRRFSSVLIDDVLLIDPGPQVLEAIQEFRRNPAAVRYILNTHKHEDHYCAETVDALTAIGAQFVNLSAGETVQLGRYTISAYAGNHATCPNTVHFIISASEVSVFYGLDGAWLLYEEVQAIQREKPSLAVLDATIGDADGDYRIFEHNNLQMVLEMQKTLAPYVGRFCISHMARTLHTDHQTLSEKMARYGITTAYDGLEIDVSVSSRDYTVQKTDGSSAPRQFLI
jgi:hypothetical protein